MAGELTIESVNVDSVALPFFFPVDKNRIAFDLDKDFSMPDVIRDHLSIRSMFSKALSILSDQMPMPGSSANRSFWIGVRQHLKFELAPQGLDVYVCHHTYLAFEHHTQKD